MRVVQLIDSLDPGGAEKMAVTLANVLQTEIAFSGLMVTRKEGSLKSFLAKDTSYLFLGRKRIIDFKALYKAKRFLKVHSVSIIHAHASSYVFAVLLKLVYPKVSIVWHDHYGNSEKLAERASFFIKAASLFFSDVIVVNTHLLKWSQKKLFTKNIYFLPNFVSFPENEVATTVLKGTLGKRIICLANLRPQKNHLFLLQIAQVFLQKNTDWTFHLVGKNFQDAYANVVLNEIKRLHLDSHIYLYADSIDVKNILSQSDVGILTSESEGLPLALLEYGLSNLPVVVTDVGEVSKVVTAHQNGLLVNSNDLTSFVHDLELLTSDLALRNRLGEALNQTVLGQFSKEHSITTLLNIYK